MKYIDTYPIQEMAQQLLKDAEDCNPGPWGDHSRVCAMCAQRIAAKCGMDSQKAYVLGLLHDIGRKFGVRHLGHVYDGYRYMTELGYTDVARVCLTHSFCVKSMDVFVGKADISLEEQSFLLEKLDAIDYDDYDFLIQLCDCLAGADSAVKIEDRMLDVKIRYGSYPRIKWDRNMELKKYFEEKCQEDIYCVVRNEVSKINVCYKQ